MQPSFLLLVVDCLRADTVAQPHDAWPETSRLVADAARFRSAYTTCPTTSPAFTSMPKSALASSPSWISTPCT